MDRFVWDGPALRRRRELRGLRVEDIARELQLSVRRVRQIESTAASALRALDVERYILALAALDARVLAEQQDAPSDLAAVAAGRGRASR